MDEKISKEKMRETLTDGRLDLPTFGEGEHQEMMRALYSIAIDQGTAFLKVKVTDDGFVTNILDNVDKEIIKDEEEGDMVGVQYPVETYDSVMQTLGLLIKDFPIMSNQTKLTVLKMIAEKLAISEYENGSDDPESDQTSGYETGWKGFSQ